MTEWFYKATPTKVSFEETRDLAVNDGFICRSAFEDNGSRADNTQNVAFRDVIHVYFKGDGEPAVIGSFEVVGPNRHPFRERFVRGVTGTALHEVSDEFATRLRGLGDASAERYQPDPVLKKLTGWAIVRRSDMVTPSFASAPFKGQATLVRA
jgi:hypothetical protein